MKQTGLSRAMGLVAVLTLALVCMPLLAQTPGQVEYVDVASRTVQIGGIRYTVDAASSEAIQSLYELRNGDHVEYVADGLSLSELRRLETQDGESPSNLDELQPESR